MASAHSVKMTRNRKLAILTASTAVSIAKGCRVQESWISEALAEYDLKHVSVRTLLERCSVIASTISSNQLDCWDLCVLEDSIAAVEEQRLNEWPLGCLYTLFRMAKRLVLEYLHILFFICLAIPVMVYVCWLGVTIGVVAFEPERFSLWMSVPWVASVMIVQAAYGIRLKYFDSSAARKWIKLVNVFALLMNIFSFLTFFVNWFPEKYRGIVGLLVFFIAGLVWYIYEEHCKSEKGHEDPF
jgi:hypothetical protein